MSDAYSLNFVNDSQSIIQGLRKTVVADWETHHKTCACAKDLFFSSARRSSLWSARAGIKKTKTK